MEKMLLIQRAVGERILDTSIYWWLEHIEAHVLDYATCLYLVES